MQSHVLPHSCRSESYLSGWKSRVQPLLPRQCGGCSSLCGTPTRLPPPNAVAGVGTQVPSTTNSSFGNSRPPTPYSGAQPSTRALNSPLQTLVRAATDAGVRSAAPAELSEVTSRLATIQSWPALQVLALQYQGRLDQQSVVALLRRAAALAAGTAPPSAKPSSSSRTTPSLATTCPSPSPSEQYACSRFLESLAMSCAPLIPAMGPPTIAALLGTLGALAASGLVGTNGSSLPQQSQPQQQQLPYTVVLLVQALILASLPLLHSLSAAQLAHVLRGCVLLSPSGLPEVWLDEWEAASSGPVLEVMPPDALEVVMASLMALYARQNWTPQDAWLGELLRGVEQQLGTYTGESLRQLALALVGLEVRPHSGWLDAFRAAFDRRVAAEQVDPMDVAGVLYAFTRMEVAFV